MNDKPLTKKEVINLLKNLNINYLETEFINLIEAENLKTFLCCVT